MQVDAPDRPRANAERVAKRVEALVGALRERLDRGATTNEQDLQFYADAVLLLLFTRYEDRFHEVIIQAVRQKRTQGRYAFYNEFLRDWEEFFQLPGRHLLSLDDAPHLFACFFQVRRAFHHIIESIVGSALAAARLRAAHDDFMGAFTNGALTADEVLQHYCTTVYVQTGSYEETARRLQLDRRTVKRKDEQLLSRLRQG
jgi:hypothetical protein